MARFQFKDHLLIIELGDLTFQVDATATAFLEEYQKKCREIMKTSEEMQARKGETASKDELNDLCDLIAGMLDFVLGENATEKIFAGRKKSFLDYLDVFGHVCGEVNAHLPAQLNAYVQPQPKNRAQRHKK